MSVEDQSVYQTPDAVLIVRENVEEHPELDRTPDIGASPVLGPTTRSGKKRKHVVPVKSSGKKKSKTMLRSPSSKQGAQDSPASIPVVPADSERRPSTSTERSSTPGSAPSAGPAGGALDLAELLTRGLTEIKSSMSGMENRLSEKMESLENSVKHNDSRIGALTSDLRSQAEELDRLGRRD